MQWFEWSLQGPLEYRLSIGTRGLIREMDIHERMAMPLQADTGPEVKGLNPSATKYFSTRSIIILWTLYKVCKYELCNVSVVFLAWVSGRNTQNSKKIKTTRLIVIMLFGSGSNNSLKRTIPMTWTQSFRRKSADSKKCTDIFWTLQNWTLAKFEASLSSKQTLSYFFCSFVNKELLLLLLLMLLLLLLLLLMLLLLLLKNIKKNFLDF